MVFQQFKPLVWTLDDYSFKAFCILSRHFLVNHSLLSFVVFNERLFAAEHNLHGRKQKQTQTLTNCATIPAVSVTSQRDIMLKNSVQCDLIPLFKWSCCTCMRSDIKRPVVIHVPLFSELMFTEIQQCKSLQMSRAFWPICQPDETDEIMNVKRVGIVN